MTTVTEKTASIAMSDYMAKYRNVRRFLEYCKQCPRYGNLWCCPPFDHDIDLSGYNQVLLIGTTIHFDDATRAACHTPEESNATAKQSIDEVWKDLLPRLYQLERSHPGSRCFTIQCRLCGKQDCTRPQGQPCRHPGKLRNSLEAIGFDVEATARDLLGITLEWSTDGLLPRAITLVTALFH